MVLKKPNSHFSLYEKPNFEQNMYFSSVASLYSYRHIQFMDILQAVLHGLLGGWRIALMWTSRLGLLVLDFLEMVNMNLITSWGIKIHGD